MELRDLVAVLSRRRITILVVTVAFALVAVALGLASGASYSATAQVLAPQTTVSTLLGEQRPARGVEWQAGIARSSEVLASAAQALGAGATADTLANAVTVVPADAISEYTLKVTGTASTPQKAAFYANAVADAYVAYTSRTLSAEVKNFSVKAGSTGLSRSDLSASIETLPLLDSARARVLARAAAPAVQSAVGRAIRMGILGLTLGLAVGIAAAFVRDQLMYAPIASAGDSGI